MNTGTLPRFSVYSELTYSLPINIHASIFGTFCIVGARRVLITESLSWKDTASGHLESRTCVLSEHIGEKGDKLCMQMKCIYTQLTHNILCVG